MPEGFSGTLPVLLTFVPTISLKMPSAGLRLPNREYWLAPERQAATLEFLRQHMARFGSMVVVFVIGCLVWTRVLLGRFSGVVREGRWFPTRQQKQQPRP